MEFDVSSPHTIAPNKMLLINEFNNIVQNLFHFYVVNRYFIIPNDVIETTSTLLGFSIADEYPLDSKDFEKNLALIKKNIVVNAERGFYLADLFKEYQENLIPELKTKAILQPTELPYALLALDINLQLGQLLVSDNKQAGVQPPSQTIEVQVNNFIRQHLYPMWLKIINSSDGLTSEYIIAELSIYLGWITGFYANLLESTADLFATYTFICVEMAANQKSKH